MFTVFDFQIVVHGGATAHPYTSVCQYGIRHLRRGVVSKSATLAFDYLAFFMGIGEENFSETNVGNDVILPLNLQRTPNSSYFKY